MEKEHIMDYIEGASIRQLRDFSEYLVSMLTNTQLKALENVFEATLSFNPNRAPQEESGQETPEINPELEPNL